MGVGIKWRDIFKLDRGNVDCITEEVGISGISFDYLGERGRRYHIVAL